MISEQCNPAKYVPSPRYLNVKSSKICPVRVDISLCNGTPALSTLSRRSLTLPAKLTQHYWAELFYQIYWPDTHTRRVHYYRELNHFSNMECQHFKITTILLIEILKSKQRRLDILFDLF